MKKITALFLSVLLMLSFSACNDGGSSSTASKEESKASSATESASSAAESASSVAETNSGSDGPYKIGLSMNALDEFQTEWLGYFEGYLKAQGHEVTVLNAESKVDKQLADVESLIQMDLDVICIKSVDQDGVVPCFEACEAAGVPSIDIDMGANTDIPAHLLSDQREFGVLIGEYANEWLEKNPDKTIEAGYLIGIDVPSVIGRRDGWIETMDEAGNKDKYNLLAEKVCNWSATEAMAVVEDWMQAYPDMNWIVAMSDEMAIAAVNVVEAAGRSGEVVICGVDGSPNAQEHIKAGTMTGTSFIPRKQLAETAGEYVIKICGGDTSYFGTDVDIGAGLYAFLTKDNIDSELAKYE